MSPSQELYEKAREALEEVLKESPIRFFHGVACGGVGKAVRWLPLSVLRRGLASSFAKDFFREGKGRPGPPKGVPRG